MLELKWKDIIMQQLPRNLILCIGTFISSPLLGAEIQNPEFYRIQPDTFGANMSLSNAWGDYDNDGDADIIISNNNGKAQLLMNEGKPKNNWIGIELEGRSCNRQAIGSKITISTESGDQTTWVNPAGSYLTSNDTRVVFGTVSYTHLTLPTKA